MSASGVFAIPGPAGRLHALLREPQGQPRFAAAICHPHPLYGGTMHNKVVHQMAKTLVAAGGITVRFQFRGVGLSEGSHDQGIGELDDLNAILTWLATHTTELPLLSCGYSFGAWVALRGGAADPRVQAVLGIGLATTVHAFDEMTASTKPKCIIQGERDVLGPSAAIEQLTHAMSEPKRLLWVPGADHFFAERLDLLGQRLEEAAAFLS